MQEERHPDERRRRRSRDFRYATRYYLQSVARQHKVSVLALVDQEGQFVAGSEGIAEGGDFFSMGMAEPLGQDMAALAVAVGDEGCSTSWAVRNEPVTVRAISAEGRRFTVVGTGPSADAAIESVVRRLPQIVRDC
jgi:hypothetical protein